MTYLHYWLSGRGRTGGNMRYVLLCLALGLSVLSLNALEVQKNVTIPKSEVSDSKNMQSRDVPEFSIAIPPTSLIYTNDDYSPYGFNTLPMQWQFNTDGMYLIYQVQETLQTTSRKVFYSYFQNGVSTNQGRITTDNLKQGYPTISINPLNDDPFVAWHGDLAAGSMLDVGLKYDLFDQLLTPNLWSDTQVVLNNGNGPAQYLWPNVFSGPSPLGANYQRIYVYAHSQATSPSYITDMKLAWCDVNQEDMNQNQPFIWTVRTIPQFDEWASSGYCTPRYAFFVGESGEVGIMGFLNLNVVNIEAPDYFVLLNENYGEGDFFLHLTNSEEIISEPGQEPLYFTPLNTNYFNVQLTNNSKVHALTNFELITTNAYYPAINRLKHITFDINTNTFNFQQLWPEDDTNQDSMFPFASANFTDIYYNNNFKITKSRTGNRMCAVWQDATKAMYYNLENNPAYAEWTEAPEIFIAISSDNGLSWSEPLALNKFLDGWSSIIPMFVQPADDIKDLGNGHGLLYLSFLDSNHFINSSAPDAGGYIMYTALDINFDDFNLAPVITEYLPVESTLQVSQASTLPFSIQANDPENSTLFYSWKVNNSLQNTQTPAFDFYVHESGTFEITCEVSDSFLMTSHTWTVVSTVGTNDPSDAFKTALKSIYPNPFNPETNISFSIAQNNTKVILNIYNVKGQLVRSFNNIWNKGEHRIVWNGKDNTNLNCGSGVYFLRMVSPEYSATKKIILIK